MDQVRDVGIWISVALYKEANCVDVEIDEQHILCNIVRCAS